MAQFSMEIICQTGSVLRGNQQQGHIAAEGTPAELFGGGVNARFDQFISRFSQG